VARINGPSTAKVGDTVNFDGRSSQSVSPIVDYQWNFGDGNTAHGSDVSHTYNQDGTYYVTLVVVAQNGLRGSDRHQINVDLGAAEQPVARISAPNAAQLGQAVTFDGSASSAPGQIVSYAWNFGDGSTANGPVIPHTYQKGPGIYNVILTITDDQGHTNSTNHQINITSSPETPTPTATPDIATNTPVPTPTETPVVDTPTPTPTLTPPPGSTETPTPIPTDTPPVATPLPLPAPTDTAQPGQPTDTPAPLPTDTPQPVVPTLPPPVAVIQAPGQATVGDGLLFDGSLSQSSSPIVSWAWDFGDGDHR
jgi:PKD repeat protein